jgi:DNA-binding NtrC family response regulator
MMQVSSKKTVQSTYGVNRGVLSMENKNSLLRILLIEDSDTDAFIIQDALRRFKSDAQCTRAATLQSGENILQKGEIDAVLLDLGLPDTASPKDTYEQIKKWAQKLPIIIMTNLKDHELAKVMVQEGAADFLNKDAIVKTPKLVHDAIDFSMARHSAGRKLQSEKEKAEQESKQKDSVLKCFMGGYSIGSGK